MQVIAADETLAENSKIKELAPPEMPDAKKPYFPFERDDDVSPFFEFVFLLHFYVYVFCVVWGEMESHFLTGFAVSGASASLGFVE